MRKKAWKKFFAAFLVTICLPISSVSIPAKAQAADLAEVSVVVDGNKIVIGNNYISRELSTAGDKLKTINITNRRTDNGETVFTPAEGSEEFKIRLTKTNASDNSDREFAASQLELSGDPVVEDTDATINNQEKTGKKITFQFKPYTIKNVAYTISEVYVMYDGDHFMRKYMEISVPEEQKENAVIDYIDLESFVVNDTDAQWTIPRNVGGVVLLGEFKANLGQPIYIQGMFFGCEFPAADTEIVNGTGYMRYYTGKSFDRLEKDNQLTQDGKYVTWQTVAGAARSTDNAVVQADFFEYIKSIATPSEFRIQYNSWFDNMMYISDENIRESFIEIDRELNQAEVRPLDSYVVDDGWTNYNKTEVAEGTDRARRAGTTKNQSGFWEFNSKFPDGLTPSSELVHKFGSNFGVWVGPRGGYNFYGDLADILTQSGMGSKAGTSIDVADRTYVKHFTEMAVKWMEEYGVNYWKWDGFSNDRQYSEFPSADGIPGYSDTHRHMTGGYQHMYHVTDLWEAWIDLMESVRQAEQTYQINKLWISLTCYVNPSPWFLQWANSVWIQVSDDQNDAGPSSSKMDRQMTYRDGRYYNFLKQHEFQFPLSNIYNHDPVYGVEGTDMDINSATDEQFKNYLYMQSTRGSAFWELYFSDSIMTEGKYEVTGEFLEWVEKNHHILKNSKMFGQSPVPGGDSTGSAYGYACFDGTDGIISFRNSANTAKEIEVVFDRAIGVPENAGTLKYHMEHSYNMPDDTPITGELAYGETIRYTLQPDEVRILRISKEGDTKAPEIKRVYSNGADEVTLKFNEKVTGTAFKVNGTEVSAAEASADGITFRLTVEEGTLEDKSEVTVTAEDVSDLAGNPLQKKSVSFLYHKDNTLLKKAGLFWGASTGAEAKDSLIGKNGFSVSAEVYTESTGEVLAQGNEYAVGINENGTAYFILNGMSAVSKVPVNDGEKHTITGIKENNGMLKIYIDGQLEGAGYKEENRYYEVKAADIVIGNDDFYGVINVKVSDIAKGYDIVGEEDGNSPEISAGETNWAFGKTVTAKWSGNNTNAAKGQDRPMSMAVDGKKNNSNYGEFGADNRNESSYMEVDLGEVRLISKINIYRYWENGRRYNGTVIALSETSDFAEKKIVFNSDKENFHQLGVGTEDIYAETENGKTITLAEPVSARYVRVYMHGVSGGGTTNHVVELEVMGTQPIPKADYSKVDAAVEAAELLTEEDYEDFSAVAAAVAAVVRGKDATEQAAVNEMAANIYKAIAVLERTPDRELSDELKKAESKDLYGYTADTIRKYQNALDYANKLLGDTASSDAEKAEAAQKLKEAINALKRLSQEELQAMEAAKKSLADIIKAAEAYKDASQYTTDSWQAFGKALAAARSALNGLAIKTEYETAAEKLNTAIAGLKLAEMPMNISEGTVYTIGGYNYKILSISQQTAEVVGLANSKVKKIQVGETVLLGGKSYKIISVGKGAFKKNADATSAVIGKNVTQIGNSAFEGCKKLKKVTVKGKNLTKLGKKAFAKCKNLKKIDIKSKKLKKVPKNAFKGIHKKAVVKIPLKKKS